MKTLRFVALVVTFLCMGGFAFAQEQEPDKGFSEAEQDLLDTAAQIAAEVAQIRGLELKSPIKKGIKRRDELRNVLVTKLAEEVSDREIEAEGKVFARLGLIPQDLDYKKMLLDVLTEQIAGFYDQKTKELYIMQGIPLNLQRPAMAHELFHGIQDQHFDILSLQAPFSSTENGDFALARSALIEGDATIVMFDFSLYESGTLPQPDKTSVVDIPMVAGMLKKLSFDDLTAIESMMGGAAGMNSDGVAGSALAQAPAIFRELLMFPYFAGMRFVVMMRIQKAWSDVDAIYENPPVSTEQILHPEKYLAGDMPVFLRYNPSARVLGEAWSPIYDTVMGEFQMRLYLKTHLSEQEGSDYSEAATGWNGDRLLAWEHDDRVMLSHLTAWDSVKDAEEYYQAMVETYDVRYPGATVEANSGKFGESTCLLRSDDSERIYVERWGDLVLVIEGAPSSLNENGKETDPTLYMMRKQAFSTLERVPYERYISEATAKSSDPSKPAR